MLDSIEVKKGQVCPYCGAGSELIDSIEVYRISYGPMYICRPCNAYVGCHKGTTNALGRLANKELREWKIKAHAVFDPLWKRKMQQGFSKTKSRHKAYTWLASELGIRYRDCHIGFFDVDTCKSVVEICSKYQ